jgi:hypothetical protein
MKAPLSISSTNEMTPNGFYNCYLTSKSLTHGTLAEFVAIDTYYFHQPGNLFLVEDR